MQWNGQNRRQYPRLVFPCTIKILNSQKSGDVILTHTDNIGAGGVRVLIAREIKRTTQVDMEIDLMDAGDRVHCRGKVVWLSQRKSADPKKPVYEVGIEFEEINPKEKQRIEESVKRMIQKGHFKDQDYG